MTGKEIADIIMQVGILVTAIASAVVSIRNSRKIEDVKKATDGMKDALVSAAKKEGAAEEKQEEKERKDLIEKTLAAAEPQDVIVVNEPEKPVPIITADTEKKK